MSTFTKETVRAHGVERLAKVTGLGVRTIYRWASEGIPGAGTIRAVREAAIAEALQKIPPLPKDKKRTSPKKRRAA